MILRILLALTTIGGLMAFAPAPPPRASRSPRPLDLKRLEGRWVLIRLERGQESGPPVVTPLSLEAEIRDGRYTYFRDNAGVPPVQAAAATSQIALDASRSPCWFDLLPGLAGSGTKGVCALEGDTLRICYVVGTRNRERPTSLTPSRAGETLMVFQRKKP